MKRNPEYQHHIDRLKRIRKLKKLYYLLRSLKESKSKFQNFLHQHPVSWKENKDYIKVYEALFSIRIVNDVAERDVKLFVDLRNSKISKNAEQKQSLLKVSILIIKTEENY